VSKLNYIADIIEEFDIVFFTETHLDNQVLDSDIIIEGFETPSRKNRDSRGGGIITYTYFQHVHVLNPTSLSNLHNFYDT
jgi:hypothetical protein